VCYCERSNCKLVCGHSFCKSCVKSWFYKAVEDPSCPMCRSKLYFKGMYKVVPKWEEERLELLQEEAFAEAFDDVFVVEEGDPSDTDSNVSEGDSEEWDFGSDSDFSDYYQADQWPNIYEEVDYRMDDILGLQERFHTLNRSGIAIHAEFLSNYWYNVISTYDRFVYEDTRTHIENMFVSKHQAIQEGKTSQGVARGYQDDPMGMFLVIVCV
jgi:hypothetical protein